MYITGNSHGQNLPWMTPPAVSCRSAMVTIAPASAIFIAQARPMPDAAPVISTERSLRLDVSSTLLKSMGVAIVGVAVFAMVIKEWHVEGCRHKTIERNRLVDE